MPRPTENHGDIALLLETLKCWLGTVTDPPVPLYLVGGSVRDYLLDRPSKDVDLVCRGARDFARRLADISGAAWVPMEKDPKAPCYRVVSRRDPGDFLDIAELFGGNIREDLGRRDFTVNAMAMAVEPGGKAGRLEDPFNGRADLDRGLIRSLSLKNLQDDPLRTLRAFRQSAHLGFRVEEGTERQISEAAPGLSRVSGERIGQEILLLLESDSSAPQVRAMDRAGIWGILFPVVSAMKGCQQKGFHHLDVWEHSLLTFEHLEAILKDPAPWLNEAAGPFMGTLVQDRRLALLKLAALFHDAGKPDTATWREELDRFSFHGHAAAGETLAGEAAERLKLSNRQSSFLRLVVAEHLHAEDLTKAKVKEKTVIAWFRKYGEDAAAILVHAMADTLATQGPLSPEERQRKKAARAAELVRTYFSEWRITLARPPLVTGADLLAMGMSQGKEMGKLLSQLRQEQDQGGLDSRETALERARKLMEAPPE